ncbi:MAG: hypothetical protein ABIJ97_01160, partial [Bacteroidota bacterium]
MQLFSKFILILIILCGGLIPLKSQSVTFNIVIADTTPIIRNIVEVDSGYVLVGGGMNNQVYIITVFIDSVGTLKWIKKIKNSSISLYHGTDGSFIANNQGYSLAGSQNNATQNGCWLLKFDNNFDTLWTQVYLMDSVFKGFYGGCTTDSGFLLTGIIDIDIFGNPVVYDNVLLIKTDNAGNMLWYKNYGGNDADIGYKVIPTYDNSYLIGGWTRSFNTFVAQGYRGDWYLVKTDTAGNKIWDRHYGNKYLDDGRMISLISTKDTGYIMTGGHAVSDGTSFVVTRGKIMKLNKYYQVEWEKLYDAEKERTALEAIIELENSDLAVTGCVENSSGNLYGTLHKLTSD